MMTSQLRATAPSGTQPNLNTTIAGNLRIPIPPRDVQQRFVKVLKKGMQLSGRVRAAAGVTDKLASAVIQRAFDG